MQRRTGVVGAVPSSTVRYQGVRSMLPISQLILDQMICTRTLKLSTSTHAWQCRQGSSQRAAECLNAWRALQV